MRLIVPGERVLVTNRFMPHLDQRPDRTAAYVPMHSTLAMSFNMVWEDVVMHTIGRRLWSSIATANEIDRYFMRGGWPSA